MASERETTVSNEGSSGLLFLPWSFLSWATTRIRPPRVSRWEGQRSFLSRGERRGVSRLCYVTRRHSFLPPPFPIIASLLPKIMYTLLYARSSFTARRIDESNDNIYFRVESGLLRSFSYTFSSSSYTLEKSFLRITKSAETLPTIDRSLFDSLVSSPSSVSSMLPNFLLPHSTYSLRWNAHVEIYRHPCWKIYSCRFAVEYIIKRLSIDK